MGGRAAEELVFKELTTGAANDFDQATNLARMMVIDYGMSPLGPINFGPTRDITEWGRSFYEQNQLSDSTLSAIEKETKTILDNCYQKAVTLLKTNRKQLDAVAKELLAKESLDGDEFLALVKK